MRERHLAILGGCLSHQASIPLSALYHRQLAVWLAREQGVRLRVHLARAFDLEPAQRLQWLLQRRRVDAVLLHWRNTTARKVPLLLKRRTDRGVEVVLHPFVLQPWRTGWGQAERSGFRD